MTNRHKLAKIGALVTKLYRVCQQLLSSQIGLANVIDLLIKKGVLTHDEVKNAIEKVNTKRAEEQLSIDREPADLDASDAGHSRPKQDVHTDESNGNSEPENTEPV